MEVFYLGDESLNAFDSAMGFQSLRSLYELGDFNDENWRDTLAVYVEDDDKQIVLNDLSEVKIGTKYYKYVTDNLMAEISDLATLDSVRLWGVLATQGTNLRFYDEQNNTITPVGEWIQLVQGCNDFNLNLVGHFTSYVNPTSNKWTIGTMVRNPVINTNSTQNKNIRANYTVDWGDGVVQSFEGYFGLINYFTHIYQYPSSGYINRTITVSCQIIQQSNPSQAYLNVLANCPSVTSTIFTSSTVIKLETFNYPDCLGGRIVRKFEGIEHIVGGTKYRVDCKLKQVSTHSSFIVAWQQAKIATTVVFRKFKNNRWKKTKSIGWLELYLKGNVYRQYDCTSLFHTIYVSQAKKKEKKLKIVVYGKDPYIWFPNDFRTYRYLPTAINADFVWRYNNNQSVVANYNERLKP